MGNFFMKTLFIFVTLLPLVAWANLPLGPNDHAAIVNVHNLIRSTYATGGVPGFPKASDMLQIRYDAQAAGLALAMLGGKKDATHPKFGKCGSSTSRLVSSSAINSVPWNTILGNCAKQKHKWNKSFSISRFTRAMTNQVGCFTQFIWARTEVVGCAANLKRANGFNELQVACVYCHAGNYLNSSIYTPGEPCSACPGKCSAAYKGLCLDLPPDRKGAPRANPGVLKDTGLAGVF
eukprot:TRINITY_DN12694_c0_g1_i1.p1 TRINITY_DN12694_c0_g1~~TRINITY_DN12694_c0_g1_i1.p1  ORF type:complete len:235 (+),score=39.33 TRINITY_DN12694_c0_g1_i1:94-798(+)